MTPRALDGATNATAARATTNRAGPVSSAPSRRAGPAKTRSRRSTFLKWLRNVHGWIGLWGAALGLMFGVTGFLLNHRAGPMKISSGEPQVSQMQMPLPDPAPDSPRALAEWVKRELKFDGRIGRIQREPAHKVAWGDRSVMQPEHWSVTLAGPKTSIAIDYWAGSPALSVKRTEGTLLAALNNMHKGTGMSIGWALLVDTIAGGLILLSLTGVLLWTELNKRKTVGAAVFVVSLVALLVCGIV
jgi:hypothetical protein